MTIEITKIGELQDPKQLALAKTCKEISDKYLNNKSSSEVHSIILNILGGFIRCHEDIEDRKNLSKRIFSSVMKIIEYENRLMDK